MVELYYLQNLSMGFLGNSPYFWADGNCGYTTRLDNARMFTKQEARTIIETTRGSHRWKRWSTRFVDKRAYRTVDMQDLEKKAKV
jgi:hypothetical protein